jgi:hypothetical protein
MSYLSDNLTEEESAFLKRNSRRMKYDRLTEAFRAEYPRHMTVTLHMIRYFCRKMSWPHLKGGGSLTTNEELEFIADCFRQGLTDEQSIKLFNRRFLRVIGKHQFCVLRRKIQGVKVPRYSPEEKRFLIDNLNLMPTRRLAENFSVLFRPKTAKELRAACAKMGIIHTEGMMGWNVTLKSGQTTVAVKLPGQKGFRLKRTVVWEAAHGKVPKGCPILHLDGDTFNCELDNLGLSLRLDVTQDRLLKEIGPGRPDLARTWLAALNLRHKADSLTRKIYRARKDAEKEGR